MIKRGKEERDRDIKSFQNGYVDTLLNGYVDTL